MPKPQALRIEVKAKVPDARSVSRRGFFNSLGISGKVENVEIIECYTVDAKLNKEQIKKTCALLANPVTQVASLKPNTQNLKPSFDFAIEISFLPGVTDNIGNTAKETISDGTGYKFSENENVYSSQVFLIKFLVADKSARYTETAQTIVDSLYNPLIQKATILSYKEFQKQNGFLPNLPLVKLTANKKTLEVDLNISDEQLAKLGKLGIKEIPSSPRLHPEAVLASHRRPKDLYQEEILRASDALGTQNDADIIRRGPLALELYQLKAIQNYFNKLGRKPTDIELETLAQTWSEHCKHIIFTSPIDNIQDGLYKHYIKRATEVIRQSKRTKPRTEAAAASGTGASNDGDFCVSVFSDNAGAIKFTEDFLITHKVETHNTPSALDPFGGAITGIVGVNRDALGFGLGAKPVINTYGFCLAEPNDKTELYRDSKMSNKMLSARRIMDGVIAGINAGGNQSGIPTNSGFMYFDSRYRGKPLVFAGTVGLIPKLINGKPSHIKKACKDDLIVMVGGRVGQDGIHGATFSSEGLSENSPSTAVQIGDPITQKKFTDAIVKEARGLYNSITDCGAGGLSSAVGEMAEQSGGCEVKLNSVPTKYPGLAPWQIWISESQERMVLALPKKNWKKFEKLMKNRGVESSVIGKFTSSGKCIVKFGNEVVMDLGLEFLHNGMPRKHLKSKPPSHGVILRSAADEGSQINKDSSASSFAKAPADMSDALVLRMTPKKVILNLLQSSNITSTAFLASQYDHEVQGTSVIKPLQGKGRVNADATVTRPLLTSQKGVVLSSSLYPEYSESDPYYMAALCIDSAISQAVCAGADPNQIALLDNFCWCSPGEPERLWQLKEAARGCFDFATSYSTPFISGKDSMYNDFKGYGADGKPIKISVPPTLLISAIGIIDDVQKSISLDAKMPGDVIYLLGNASQKIDASKNLSLYRAFNQTITNDLISSAISVGRGGLAIALSKMAIGGQLGVTAKWVVSSEQWSAPIPGLIIATVNPRNIVMFEKSMNKETFLKIGTVTKEPTIKIKINSNKISIPLKEATAAYHSTFKNF